MVAHHASPALRLQIIAVSIFGAIAVVSFVLSLVLDGGLAEILQEIALFAAIICAAIGISFAITGAGLHRR